MKDINLKIIVYNNNEVRFQDKIGEKKQDALKHRVAKIADGYRSQLNEEERSRIKSLQFVIKPDGKFRIVADFKKVKTEIGENQLDFAKKDIQRLLKTMQRLNLLPQAKPSPAAPLISPYFRETFHKKSVSFVQNLIKFFQTFTVFYLELRPLANKLLEKPINDAATRDDLINLYIQPDPQLFREIRDHIQKNHPAIYSNFSQDEIDHFVNDLMLEKINKKLVSLKALPIDEKEHYRLDIQRMLVHLASDPSSKKAYTELMTSNPLEIPIDELAKIPVKEGQSEALAQVWEGILKNLFKIGRLDTLALKSDTSGLLVQTEYAHKYLEVFDKMPESIERNLKDFIDELNVRQPVNNLKSFIVHHSLVYSENISFEDLTEKQKVYREQVRPSIQAFIASNEKKQKDSNALIKYLILAGNSKKEMDSVLDKIHEDLSEDERKILPRDLLDSFFFNELELIAVTDYNFISPQLVNLRKFRTDAPEEDINLKEDFNLNDALFDDKILDQISISSPKKNSFLTPSEQAELMRLTKLLSIAKQVWESETEDVLAEKEQLELKEILDRLSTDENIKRKLKNFVDSDETESFLGFFPPFIKNIIKKFTTPPIREKIPTGITNDAIEFLVEYFSQTKNMENQISSLKQIQNKANALIEKYENNPLSISFEDRLTLKEMGILSHSMRFLQTNFVEEIDFLQLPKNKPDLEMLKKLSSQSKNIYTKIESLVKPEVNDHYKNGDLLAYVGGKKSAWVGKPVSFEDRLTTLIASGFTHAAKLYRNNDKIKISQINSKFAASEVSLYQLCVSDVWELDVSSLMNTSTHNILHEIYGNSWKEIVNRQYQEIEHDLHQKMVKKKSKFKKIKNDEERRVLAGLADRAWLFNVKGHQRKTDRDFRRFHEKFFGDKPLGTEQICSEFVSKTTLACMLELNKRLTDRIKEHLGEAVSENQILKAIEPFGISKDVRDYLEGIRHYGKDSHLTRNAQKELIKSLKAVGYNSNQISLIIRLGNQEILDLPYSKRERLRAIHPGRMVSLLEKKRCIRKKEPPEIMRTLIQLN